jgi:hypothetical protein
LNPFRARHGLRVISGNTALGSETANVILDIQATDAIQMPTGNTGQRPTAANGMIRYNSEENSFEGYAAGAWGDIGGAGGGYYKGNLGAIGDATNANNLLRINGNTQSNDITIAAGENALMVGPVTIGTGNTLTVAAGGRVVIA